MTLPASLSYLFVRGIAEDAADIRNLSVLEFRTFADELRYIIRLGLNVVEGAAAIRTWRAAAVNGPRQSLQKIRIASLRAGGFTWQDISEQLGVSLRTAYKNRAATLLLRKSA